jgi:DNA-binding transcriptional ArsR family regulator
MSETEKSVLAKLDEIAAILAALIHLLVPEPTPDRYDLKGEQREVYELCDSTHTIKEIVHTVGKPASQIRGSLTRLKKKGLVGSIKRKGTVLYYRVPAKRTASKPEATKQKESLQIT